MENRELHFPEKVLVRKYTKLDSICEETLLKYMDKLVVAVEKEVAETLPEKFGMFVLFNATSLAGHLRSRCFSDLHRSRLLSILLTWV